DTLYAESAARVREMLAHGTTTLESKSGYGLQRATERRLLETNRRLQDELPIEIASTYLGAHAFPDDTSPAEYVNEVIDFMPELAERGLAEFCDVYCDEGYF